MKRRITDLINFLVTPAIAFFTRDGVQIYFQTKHILRFRLEIGGHFEGKDLLLGLDEKGQLG